MDLANCHIAVPETRELDVFSDMLERRGAMVVRCPLVAIHDAPDPQPVLQWLRAFAAEPPDDLILLTGEGLRRLLRCINLHEPELHAPFVRALAQVRTVTRGPKPARALRELGLKPSLAAEYPTTDGVIATLQRESLAGRAVGVQLYGSEPNQRLIDFLHHAGATPRIVAPYIYADATEDARVMDLIQSMAAGEIDAIAFTSMAQVQRLFRLAGKEKEEPLLRDALARCTVAAVGPVVADTLRDAGVRVDVMPGEAFFLKPLTTALAEVMAQGNRGLDPQ